MVTKPVETICVAVDGTRNILELAKENDVKSVVYISSMEVYGSPDASLPYVSENDYGYVDILNVRSCYPEGKRMCECLCTSYAHEYNLPIKIARLAQTFGAGVSKNETRVFAQFARSLINEEDIILHTKENPLETIATLVIVFLEYFIYLFVVKMAQHIISPMKIQI